MGFLDRLFVKTHHAPPKPSEIYKANHSVTLLGHDVTVSTMMISLQLGITYDIGCISATMIGSKYICNPPVYDTDEDWLILVKNIILAEKQLRHNSHRLWAMCDDYGFNRPWMALRSTSGENRNIILVECPLVYLRWRAATELAKKLNLTSKADRIALHDLLMSDKKTQYSGPIE
jgi:hypothetical protein